MAKKKEEEVKSRVLTKIIAGTVATLPAESPNPVTFTGGQGWNSVVIGAQTLIYNIQTIDLSGYARQDMTLFAQGILMQDMDTVPISNGVGTAAAVKRATIVSTTPINEGDLSNTNGLTWSLPGSIPSTHDLDNILQGRMNVYLEMNTFTGLQIAGQTTWGSADSTAAEKIWLCDAYLVPTIASLVFPIPDQAFVLPSIIAHEPELEYMMRLARSLEPVY
jgi:hypothetical protein